MSHPTLILLRTGLAAEELRPPLVEVDKLLSVLASLGFILRANAKSVLFPG